MLIWLKTSNSLRVVITFDIQKEKQTQWQETSLQLFAISTVKYGGTFVITLTAATREFA